MKLTICFLTLLPMHSVSAATYYYARPYQDRTQNPFWQGVMEGTMYLEDFEDGSLNTPYVTGFGGGLHQAKSTPNVDGDDGKVDGRWLGYTWTISGAGGGGGQTDIRFDFGMNAQGELPKYAGAALFGFVSAESGLTLYEKILVYDANGFEITMGQWKLEVPKLASGVSEVEASRFVGIFYEGGISRITFPNAATIDHLTYGYAIPEPSSGVLLLGGLGAALSRRRR